MYVPLFWLNMYFQGTGVYDATTVKAAILIGVANFGAPV